MPEAATTTKPVAGKTILKKNKPAAAPSKRPTTIAEQKAEKEKHATEADEDEESDEAWTTEVCGAFAADVRCAIERNGA
jgi:hypothetical protein